LFLAGLLLALALTADRPSNPLAARPIRYLGEISYSTYLVHFLLYIVFKILFVEDPANVSPTLIGLFLVLTFAASVALYHGVERPAQRALNRMFDRQSSPSPAFRGRGGAHREAVGGEGLSESGVQTLTSQASLGPLLSRKDGRGEKRPSDPEPA
jgi:peptidoglycan/LPS O-acetylase OafA/YrhL